MSTKPRRLDILLVHPPWASLGSRGSLQNCLPPLGILSIAAYAEQHDFSVAVLDVHAERLSDLEVKERIATHNPRYIGLTVLTNMVVPTHSIARLCKEAVDDCHVILGGVHAEAMPEDMLRNSAVDAVVQGDGEEAVVELLGGAPWSSIQGLVYLENGLPHYNPPRPIEKDLDKYPLPAYHLVDFDNYFPAVGSYRRLPAINMLMTRGCIGKCTFCNSAHTTVRTRSPRSVVNQIKLLRYEYGIRQVQFYDDTFTVMKQNALEFCRLLKEEKVDITWTAYIRGDCFSKEMAKAMRAAGCHQVLMGVESGDPEILRSIAKPIAREKYVEAVRLAHEQGMEVRGSFILGNIGETPASLEASLRFAIELDLDLMQMGILTPLPGTRVFDEAVTNGYLLHRNWNEYGADKVILSLPTITEKQIYDFERHAFRAFYLRPKMILRQLKRVVSIRQIRDLFMAFLTFIIGTVAQRNPKWECWGQRSEADFQDIDFESAAPSRLTYELRDDGGHGTAGEN